MEQMIRKSDSEFFRFMRVTKKTFNDIVGQLQSTERFAFPRPSTAGKMPTSPPTAVAATLWYLGNLSAQRDIAEQFNISQGHLSHIVKDVVDFLCGLALNLISWPTKSELVHVEEQFKEMAQFPGIVGAIDGCHVPIMAPDYCQSDYIDRNHNHSVNLLADYDANKWFTYCFAGFPGSVHDQRVFANSALGQALDTSSRKHFPSDHYHIVGDSAFQLKPTVMVTYKDTGALTVKELNYNKKLSQTRRAIENAFGFLNGRFRCLKKLECKLDRAPQTIMACCVLHNITISDNAEIEMLLRDTDMISSTEPTIPVTSA